MRWIVAAVLLLAACEGPTGPEGPAGTAGQDGQVGPRGPSGPAGPTGAHSGRRAMFTAAVTAAGEAVIVLPDSVASRTAPPPPMSCYQGTVGPDMAAWLPLPYSTGTGIVARCNPLFPVDAQRWEVHFAGLVPGFTAAVVLIY